MDGHEDVHRRWTLPADVLGHLDAATPVRVFLPGVARAHVERVAGAVRSLDADGVRVRAAYSIKTNPDPRVLAAVLDGGLHVEAISQLEVGHALRAGFAPDQVVLNGPGKWWPEPLACGPFAAVFCDSVEELRQTVERAVPAGAVVGVRVRPAGVVSRFGVDLHDEPVLTAVARALAGLDPRVGVGLHVHVSPRDVGAAGWWQVVDDVVGLAGEVEERSGRPVRCLDLGGGWDAAGLLDHLLPGLPDLLTRARERLASLAEVVLEPGRAVAQPLAALVTRVLAVRGGPGVTDVVVDASIADVPEIGRSPHRWFMGAPHGCPLPAGSGTVLGRSCMESDVLAAGLGLPDGIAAGDVLVITDVGAYDTSKSYPFGLGDARWPPDGLAR